MSFCLICLQPIPYYLNFNKFRTSPAPSSAIMEGENSWKIRVSVFKPPQSARVESIRAELIEQSRRLAYFSQQLFYKVALLMASRTPVTDAARQVFPTKHRKAPVT